MNKSILAKKVFLYFISWKKLIISSKNYEEMEKQYYILLHKNNYLRFGCLEN